MKTALNLTTLFVCLKLILKTMYIKNIITTTATTTTSP